jgi:hypothetical protein
MVLSHAKAPSNAVFAIWDVMIDGEDHSGTELMAAAGYSRPDSKGYREVMKWFKMLDIVEKNGQNFKFTDKVYKFGSRPN